MANRKFFVDVQLNKRSLIEAKLYPLSTSARTSLSLTSGDAGLAVYDTTLLKLLVWSGSAWADATPALTGGLIFRGALTAAAEAPAAPASGDLYVFTSAGVLPLSWRFDAVVETTVESGDQAFFDGTSWQYLQGNSVSASETVEGLLALATQAEANAGSVTNKALTPATQANYVPPSALTLRPVRRFSEVIASLVAATPRTITHNLALSASAQVIVSTYQGGEEIFLEVIPTTANALTVESDITLSNVRVVVVG